MPTYDYRCNACKHKFELFQSMTAKHIKVCPKCGQKQVERLIGTGAALLFKGSGFYQTDYRSDSYTKASDADKKASEPKTETTAEGKGEQKSGTKAETKAESKTDPKSGSKPDMTSSRSDVSAKAASDKPKASTPGKKSRS